MHKQARSRVVSLDVKPPPRQPGVVWEEITKQGDTTTRRYRMSNGVMHIEKKTRREKVVRGETYLCESTSHNVVSAVIPYQKILDVVKVEQDDMTDTPWSNCDGWEHTPQDFDAFSRHVEDTAKPDTDWDYAKLEAHFRAASNYANVQGRDPNVRLLFDDPSQLQTWASFHRKGASKQVARELAAHVLKGTHEQLVKWYEEGWTYWYVHGEFRGIQAGCGGVDDEEYAEGGMRHEIASEIIHGLKAKGYLVRGLTRNSKKKRREKHLINMRRKLHEQVPGSEFHKYASE